MRCVLDPIEQSIPFVHPTLSLGQEPTFRLSLQPGFWHNPWLQITKIELQSASAAQTDKRTAGVSLDTLSALAYKEKKEGRICLARFWNACEAYGKSPGEDIYFPSRSAKIPVVLQVGDRVLLREQQGDCSRAERALAEK